MKGNRLGFRDDAGSVVWQAMRTVQALKPGIFFMENVTAIESSSSLGVGESDLDTICNKMNTELPGNRLLCMKHVDPTKMGYPARRDRVALVGRRDDLISAAALTTTFRKMLASPLERSSTTGMIFWAWSGVLILLV